MILYIVGENTKEFDGKVAWNIQGVFDSEEEALKHCYTDSFFIGPLKLNVPLPMETVDWPGCYYPSEKRNIMAITVIIDGEHIDIGNLHVHRLTKLEGHSRGAEKSLDTYKGTEKSSAAIWMDAQYDADFKLAKWSDWCESRVRHKC